MGLPMVRVLIVDDNALDAEAFSRFLSNGDPAFETRMVASGAEALRAALGFAPDCILLDYSIPGEDGLETLAALRAAAPERPIVFLTGFEDPKIAVAAMKAGAADYLSKDAISPGGLSAVVRGTVERAALIRRITQEREATDQIFAAASEAIIALDARRRILSINPVGRRMLGDLAGDCPIDWPDQIGFRHRHDDAAADPIGAALRGERLAGEPQVIARGALAPERFVRVSSAPIQGEGDDAAVAALLIQDVTDQEASREKIERSSRFDALGQLTGGIAHDFNNLLATLQYAIKLAAMQPQSEAGARYLSTAESAVNRGISLTGRLLSFTRNQPQRASSEPVAAVLEGVRQLIAPSIGQNIAVTFAIEGEGEGEGDAESAEQGLYVYCDVSQLENALINLILNSRDAIQSAGESGAIQVRARGVDAGASGVAAGIVRKGRAATDGAHGLRYVEFSVTDNGPGMSAEVKRCATDPFFTTKPPGSGAGLGLSLAFGFAEQSDGALRIYSALGQGVTVRLSLPRGDANGAREGAKAPAPVAAGRGERILLVEDEDALRDTAAELLSSLGYAVASARSAAEAIEITESGLAIDLLLTDVVMPDVGGFELAERLCEVFPEMPVVYMSGYTGFSPETIDAAMGPVIAKPCAPEELSKALRACLSKTA